MTLLKKAVALITLCSAIATTDVFAVHPYIAGDGIPQRVLYLSGDSTTPGAADHIAVLYSREGMSFNDPGAPRFLFFDREGKVALGIGGYVRASAMYDFNGAIASNGFTTFDIPVPRDPGQRNRFGADASHSTIFLKLVSRPTSLGRVTVYMQTNFTGDEGGYGLKLKQAYVSVGNVTAGLAHSVFSDPESQAPTIDTEGPSGQVDKNNIMFKYAVKLGRGFSIGASLEVPTADYRLGSSEKAIAQRCPDIPAYIQYAWGKSDSHLRLSGIFRRLSYRDLAKGDNRFESGWGVQVSTTANITGGLDFFGHYVYGKGIASYINDLADGGYDLIPSATDGRLTAPAIGGLTAGLAWQASPKVMVSADYSNARLYDSGRLGSDTYRYAQYVSANIYYNITGDFKVGAEYLFGTRKDYGGEHNKANRFEAMMQYSF